MKYFAVSILGMFASFGALAAGCDWATDTPPDDAKYKYFVAKSYSDTSASDAANKAERDIDSQLGRLFGVSLDVQSAFYADESTSAGTTRSYERSIGTLALKGLERQKSDVARESGGWVGCVQYRYSQREFQREKERLSKLPVGTHSASPFTEVAGDTTCRGAPVEIRTVPEKAFVTLDNGKYQGFTPIKFGNVCTGKYTLEITKDNYEPVQEQLVVPSNGTINKTLKRGTKRITVRTSLGNSQIEINGVDYGKEPVKFNAPLGIEQTITATNAEAVKITRSREFSKDSDSEYVINMEKLPGRLDFSAFKVRNPGVRITVDGKEIKGNTTGELSPDIEHLVELSKKDFVSKSENITVKGGETTYYPSAQQTFSKDDSNWARGLLGMTGLAFVGGAYSNYDFGLTAGLELGARKRMNDMIGIRGGIGVQWLNIDVGSSNLKYDIYKYEFHPLSRNQSCPAGQQCEYRVFYQHTASGGYNDSYYGYFSDSDEPIVALKTQKFDWEYNEPFFANLGFVIGDDWYIYGAGAIGFIKGTSASKSLKSTLVRFGAGIQWNIHKFGGIRLQYLTSGHKIELPYEFDASTYYAGTDYREHNQPDYVWLYRGETKNISGQKNIDAIQSLSLSFFVGF